MCGLSRARFYQLQRAGIFPPPLYDVATCGPIYDDEMQMICLEVRRRNFGVNGKPILFYARHDPLAPKPRAKTPAPKKDQYPELMESLQSLGLANVTVAEVGATVKELYPNGTAEANQADVVRAVFLHLRRKNSGDNVGR